LLLPWRAAAYVVRVSTCVLGIVISCCEQKITAHRCVRCIGHCPPSQ